MHYKVSLMSRKGGAHVCGSFTPKLLNLFAGEEVRLRKNDGDDGNGDVLKQRATKFANRSDNNDLLIGCAIVEPFRLVKCLLLFF